MSEKLEFLKNCFENEEEYKKFAQKVDDNGIKIADLTSGEYVAKKKFDDKATELSNLQAKYTELEKNSQTDDVSKKKIEDLEKQLKEANDKYTTLDRDYNHYLQREKVTGAGFKKEFADFVVSEINKNVSDTVDFETAMKGYKAKNPQFTETEKKVFKTGSMPDMTGTNKDTKNNNDFMNALIRGEN